MIWESGVNLMMLDERVLFPSPVLGGLARMVLARRMPDVAVLDLRSRGHNSIVIAVTRNAVSFELSVRFKVDRKGYAFVTSMHRRIRTCDGFGGMQDDNRFFLTDEPDDRIVLRTSRYAYRSFWETGLKDEWNWEKAAAARQKINRALDAGGFAKTFIAILPSKQTTTVLPLTTSAGS
ncbi:hypothetical protein OIU34_19130 [Pararhizobium sp. BT-229]|uniref:hypothetical protein n=1 Tax=Pararhizobium sp. BT-229 TaxID=2986923 RepID=UPI0021F7D2B7|nr:hypothetical protein [Pararhizobium sp. BT-229]MCV9963996.1 hypothetical protein [Pararhizobium sp. BT-229]